MTAAESYPNLDAAVRGCTSGRLSEWPHLRPEAAAAIAEIDRLRVSVLPDGPVEFDSGLDVSAKISRVDGVVLVEFNTKDGGEWSTAIENLPELHCEAIAYIRDMRKEIDQLRADVAHYRALSVGALASIDKNNSEGPEDAK